MIAEPHSSVLEPTVRYSYMGGVSEYYAPAILIYPLIVEYDQWGGHLAPLFISSFNSAMMFEENGPDSQVPRPQERKSTRKSLRIEAPCSVNDISREQSLTIDTNDKMDDETVERYKSECQKWDQLVKDYETRLTSLNDDTNFPSKEWISTDRVTQEHLNLIYPEKYLDTYDSLESLSNSLVDINNDIFYELEKLSRLIQEQYLFLKSFRKKLCLKQKIYQDMYNLSDSPTSLLSEFLNT
ncbi:unnamed protein product [Trichobilharzia szidati]|nr:unnamed protein product [Trichobilharzia szidati]